MHKSALKEGTAIILTVDIVSWVIVGLAIGGAWAFLWSGEHIKLPGTLLSGILGALAGGFLFLDEGTQAKYSVTALFTSIVGAVLFLVIYAVVVDRKPRHQPPIDLPSAPR